MIDYNTDRAALTRLIDDLLWMYHSSGKGRGVSWEEWEAVQEMITDYTIDSQHYSDGSPVGGEYIPDDVPNVIVFGPFPPPHRRTAEEQRRIEEEQHQTRLTHNGGTPREADSSAGQLHTGFLVAKQRLATVFGIGLAADVAGIDHPIHQVGDRRGRHVHPLLRLSQRQRLSGRFGDHDVAAGRGSRCR